MIPSATKLISSESGKVATIEVTGEDAASSLIAHIATEIIAEIKQIDNLDIRVDLWDFWFKGINSCHQGVRLNAIPLLLILEDGGKSA